MPAYTVYLDQVFMGSLVMNLMILWLTAKLGKSAYLRIRLLGGAAIGAVYSLFVYIPAWEVFLTPGYKLIASILIITAMFTPCPPKKFLILLGCFYLSTFMLGGAVLGLITFAYNSQTTSLQQAIDSFLWYAVFISLLIYWLLGKYLPETMRKNILQPLLQREVIIRFKERVVCLKALLDTGNSLKDPLTGQPVIIAEYAAVKELLPVQAASLIEAHKSCDSAEVLAKLDDYIMFCHFRLIPYRSVGCEDGWLLGFRPDRAELKSPAGFTPISDCVIALYHNKLQGNVKCSALLPIGLL